MKRAKTIGSAALFLTVLLGQTAEALVCNGGITPPPGGCLPGFPISLAGAGLASPIHGHPIIADLGLLAGHKQIVFATQAGKLWAVNDDGSIPRGFPLTIPNNAAVVGGPAVGDVDGDGKPDIVVEWGTLPQGANPPGGFGAYKNNGPGNAFTLLWQRTTMDFIQDGVPDGAISTPAIGDVDGDGRNEVVVGTLDEHIYVVNGATGVDKPGWPYWVGDTIFSSPALADLDGDGKLEVIIGTDAHNQGPLHPGDPPTTDGGLLVVLNSGGVRRPGFPIQYDQVIASAPVVGDIDGDGRPEIVFGTGSFFAVPQSSHRVYAVHCDGTTVAGWPVQVDGQVSTSPALADLDGDGIVDVVVTDDNTGPSKTFHVYAFKGTTGALLWSAIPKGHFGETLSAGDPVIADVLVGGPLSGKEVLVPENAEIVVFDAVGTQITQNGPGAFNFYAASTVTGVAVDVSGGIVEIATTTGDASNTIVAAWKGSGSTTDVPWGMFHRDAAADGLAPNAGCCPVTPTATNTGPYCIGSTISLSTPAVLGATYSWTGPNGFTSVIRNPTISNATAANAGTYSVKVTTAAGCTSAPGTTNVVVSALATPAVTAPSAVMAGSPNWTANVPAHAGSTYAWGITNGTITAGQGTSQITFTAGTAGTPLTLSVAETTASGCVSATGTKTITVTPAGPVGFFYTVTPCRMLDTRSGAPISPGGTLAVVLTGAPCNIPSTATSVSANAVATQETSSGHLTIYPADQTQPLVSSINFNAGQTRPNNTLLGLSRDGTGRVNVVNGSGGTTHVVIDVNGYFQ